MGDLTLQAEGYFMTTEDELAARGRIVTDYAQAKARLASLENEARRLSEKFGLLEQQLRYPQRITAIPDLRFLDAQNVERLIKDLQQTNNEKLNLQQKLKAIGVDVSD